MKRQEPNIGLRQAQGLCQMAQDERLAFLAEGLPIILSSAQSLWRGSRKLHKEMPREAGILEGFAEEEAAKALILMDAVRCPSHLIAQKMGTLIKWSYNHLARLIYAQAAGWRPSDVAQLQEYVDSMRTSHFLEGYAGEYILPNWNLYKRESNLYVDIEAYESGRLGWNNPLEGTCTFDTVVTPISLLLVEAMSVLGIFTSAGLKATSDIWGQVEFVDKKGWQETQQLTRDLINRLILEDLPSKKPDQHFRALFSFWQLPMYNIDFSMIPVSLEELEAEQEAEREAMYWSFV